MKEQWCICSSDLILGYCSYDRFVFHSAGISNNMLRAEVKRSPIFCPCVCFLWPDDTCTVQLDYSLPFAEKLLSDLNRVAALSKEKETNKQTDRQQQMGNQKEKVRNASMGCSGVRPHSEFAHIASILMLSFKCKAGACLSERFLLLSP